MAFCKKCGKPIIWEHEGVSPKEGWKPYDVEEISLGVRTLHFDNCKPNKSFVDMSKKISKEIKSLKNKEIPLQIGNDEFI